MLPSSRFRIMLAASGFEERNEMAQLKLLNSGGQDQARCRDYYTMHTWTMFRVWETLMSMRVQCSFAKVLRIISIAGSLILRSLITGICLLFHTTQSRSKKGERVGMNDTVVLQCHTIIWLFNFVQPQDNAQVQNPKKRTNLLIEPQHHANHHEWNTNNRAYTMLQLLTGIVVMRFRRVLLAF